MLNKSHQERSHHIHQTLTDFRREAHVASWQLLVNIIRTILRLGE